MGYLTQLPPKINYSINDFVREGERNRARESQSTETRRGHGQGCETNKEKRGESTLVREGKGGEDRRSEGKKKRREEKMIRNDESKTE